MHPERLAGFVALALAIALVAASPATAAPATVAIGSHRYDVSTVDPSQPASVGRFLAKLQRAHDDASLDWLAQPAVSRRLRDAVVAYISQPGRVTTRTWTTRTTTTYGYHCKVATKRVESHSPGLLRWYYEQRVPFCANGKRVQTTPRPTIRTNAYFGWGYRGANVEQYWFPAPTTYRVHSRGKFVLRLGWLTMNTHRPEVTTTVRASGRATTSAKCGCN